MQDNYILIMALLSAAAAAGIIKSEVISSGVHKLIFLQELNDVQLNLWFNETEKCHIIPMN